MRVCGGCGGYQERLGVKEKNDGEVDDGEAACRSHAMLGTDSVEDGEKGAARS